MRTTTAFAALFTLMFFSAAAHADPFAKADPKAGKSAYEEAKCQTCHNSLKDMGGDGNRIFTRPDRRVKDSQGLLRMVRLCADRTGAAVFPEDTEHIAAYLNQQFYKFQQ